MKSVIKASGAFGCLCDGNKLATMAEGLSAIAAARPEPDPPPAAPDEAWRWPRDAERRGGSPKKRRCLD
jgi:hypothetical protein